MSLPGAGVWPAVSRQSSLLNIDTMDAAHRGTLRNSVQIPRTNASTQWCKAFLYYFLQQNQTACTAHRSEYWGSYNWNIRKRNLATASTFTKGPWWAFTVYRDVCHSAFHWIHSASVSFSGLLPCSSPLTAMGCDKQSKPSGPLDTYKADFQEIKYQMCMFAKIYILEFGNTDFNLQVVVNLGQLSRLNSVEVLFPYVSFLSFLEAPSPSGQNEFVASTRWTATLGFGLHAKPAHPSTRDVGVFQILH